MVGLGFRQLVQVHEGIHFVDGIEENRQDLVIT